MATLWAILFLTLLLVVLVLHVFSLPANWILAGLVAVWKLTHPLDMSWGFVLLLFGVALLGEVLELVAQAYGAKRFGSTGRGNIGGLIGAFAGAIVGTPFLFGLGALIGALGGAFLGCWILELGQGRGTAEAGRSAWGAFWGKFFGMALKFGLGMGMFALTAVRVWPR
jgi:uncharacterized protein